MKKITKLQCLTSGDFLEIRNSHKVSYFAGLFNNFIDEFSRNIKNEE